MQRRQIWIWSLSALTAGLGGLLLISPLSRYLGLMLCGIGGVSLVCMVLTALSKRYPRLSHWGRRIVLICFAAFTLLFCVTEGKIIRTACRKPEEDVQYLLVLGAKVNGSAPSMQLRERIDAAADYLLAHPDTVCIVSGGKGDDENISEAECMRRGLCQRGIRADSIWMEENSTSTWENLRNTLALIREKTGDVPLKIGIVSSEYHLFRAGLLAREAGVEAITVPAKTGLPILKINYYIREVAGVWHFLILGGRYI